MNKSSHNKKRRSKVKKNLTMGVCALHARLHQLILLKKDEREKIAVKNFADNLDSLIQIRDIIAC